MGKTVSRALMLALAAGAFTTTAAVAEGEFSANIGATTDYVWRGVTQNDEDFAVFGGLDYADSSGFYVGTWAAMVDFGAGSDAEVEVDFYGGFAGEVEGGLSYDVGAIYYVYPGTDGEDLDFLEIYGGLGYEFEGGIGVGGYVYFDPDNENVYVEGSASYGFTENFSGDVTVGNYEFDGGGDYTNWSVGGTLSAAGFDFDLRYWDTDINDALAEGVADERVVLTVTKSFP